MGWIFWAIVIAAIVHVVEEFLGGWLNWARRYMPGVTLAQFVIINAIFVIGCLIAAIVGERNLVVSLSIASLLLVNALIHLLPAIVMRRYTPGAISALVLYVPLGVYAFVLASNRLTLAGGLAAGALGLLWMAVPLAFQGIRLLLVQHRY